MKLIIFLSYHWKVWPVIIDCSVTQIPWIRISAYVLKRYEEEKKKVLTYGGVTALTEQALQTVPTQ